MEYLFLNYHILFTLYITSSTFLNLPIVVFDVQYFHIDFTDFRLLSQHVLIKSEMVNVISSSYLFS